MCDHWTTLQKQKSFAVKELNTLFLQLHNVGPVDLTCAESFISLLLQALPLWIPHYTGSWLDVYQQLLIVVV